MVSRESSVHTACPSQGMRVVNNAEEFVDALESAKREAMASFADDRFLVQPWKHGGAWGV